MHYFVLPLDILNKILLFAATIKQQTKVEIFSGMKLRLSKLLKNT